MDGVISTAYRDFFAVISAVKVNQNYLIRCAIILS